VGSVGAYGIDVSGEGTLYQKRVDYCAEPGIEADVAEGASLRNADAELLHQSRWAKSVGVEKEGVAESEKAFVGDHREEA
jgi:hypothetical protein